MTDDYEPANQYEDETDAVRAGLIPHDSVYCEHGRYVGGWAGGDYLCGYCEDGVSMEQLRAEHRAAALAGELCQFRGHEQLPGETELRVLVWRVYCVPVGPCPHVVTALETFPAVDIRPGAEHHAFWLKVGAITYHYSEDMA